MRCLGGTVRLNAVNTFGKGHTTNAIYIQKKGPPKEPTIFITYFTLVVVARADLLNTGCLSGGSRHGAPGNETAASKLLNGVKGLPQGRSVWSIGVPGRDTSVERIGTRSGAGGKFSEGGASGGALVSVAEVLFITAGVPVGVAEALFVAAGAPVGVARALLTPGALVSVAGALLAPGAPVSVSGGRREGDGDMELSDS